MIDFLRKLVNYFEAQQVPYMLSGSVAMSLYTEPRFTRDYDFIVHLKTENVDSLVKTFSEGYYCDEESVRHAVKTKGMFNIIDHQTGYKADFMILKNDDYRITEFERRRSMKFLDMNLVIVSPEDLLISKLIWIQQLQSGIQMEDIRILSGYPALDWSYINRWLGQLKLNTFGLLKHE